MNTSSTRNPYQRLSPGLWLTMAMAVMQALYAVWAFTDPTALAAYRGTPLPEPADTAWVQAYGSRTLFVASVVALLLIRKDVTNLRWVALLGLVMPLSDALVALRADLPPAVVYRHVGTGVYLLITFAALARWKRTATTARP